MLFNSVEYLIFLPIVVLVYFSIPQRWRWVWLLGASYYFYMRGGPIYGILIFSVSLVAYVTARIMARTESQPARWSLLLISLAINLGLLFFFKYYNFAANSLDGLLNLVGRTSPLPHLTVVLPIGISFYVLQAVSYTIDVFRRQLIPESNPGILLLYISFFPQLVAGPIERAGNLLPQFRVKHDFDEQRVSDGLKLILWGFFKKLVIADNLRFYVYPVFARPEDYTGWSVLLAAYLFAFQIYCDFSGYSDIAIGTARIFGIDLMENFRRPFLARSVQEFWQRWHISLTTWFRDYVYFPLGGSRGVTVQRAHMNVFAIYLLSGLWHGAQWTYVVWGALNGLFYIIAKWLRLPAITSGRIVLRPLLSLAGIFITFNLFAFSLLFFRAANLSEALYLLGQVPQLFTSASDLSFNWRYVTSETLLIPTTMFLVLAMLMGVEILQERGISFRNLVGKLPAWNRWVLYYVFVLVIIIFGSYSMQASFIYFQF